MSQQIQNTSAPADDRVQKARAFAIKAHGQQKYGDKPYVFHLDQVVALLQKYGEESQIVGYLHDTVEDTPATVAGIRREFGSLVADCVDLVSDAPGPDRKTRKAKTYARLARVSGPNELALVVKAADRLANVRMCLQENNQKLLRVYQQEQPAFYRSAYRPGLCEEFWTELQRLLRAN